MGEGKFKLTITGIEPEFVDAVAKRIIEITQPDFFKDQEQKFDVHEAAKLIDKSEQTVRMHIRKGLLKAHRVGKSYTINETDLKKYLNGE